MQAVYAAVRPEINQGYLTLEISLKRKWSCVEPGVIGWELGRSELAEGFDRGVRLHVTQVVSYSVNIALCKDVIILNRFATPEFTC
jgi:hypothetical protein